MEVNKILLLTLFRSSQARRDEVECNILLSMTLYPSDWLIYYIWLSCGITGGIVLPHGAHSINKLLV